MVRFHLNIPFLWCLGDATGRASILTVPQQAKPLSYRLTIPSSPLHLFSSRVWFPTQEMGKEEGASEASQIFPRACFSDELQADGSSFCPAFEEGSKALQLQMRVLNAALRLLRHELKIFVCLFPFYLNLEENKTHKKEKENL